MRSLLSRIPLLFFSFLPWFTAALRADSPVEMFQSALDAYFNGHNEESIYFFEKILEIDPKNKKAMQGLKNAQRKKKEQLRRNREQERQALYVAEAYLSRGKFVEAFDRGNEILARTANLPEALKLIKTVQKKAAKSFRQAKPDSSSFFEAQGNVAYMNSDWFKAVASWEKVLEFNKDRADLMQRLSEVKKKLAERQREERVQLTLDLAKANVQRGFFSDAVTGLDEVLRMDPTNAEARILLNDARRSLAQVQQAKRDNQVQSINEKAMDAFTLGHRDEALALFNKTLKIDPKNRLANEYKERILGRDTSLLDKPVIRESIGGFDLAKASAFLQEEKFVEAIEILERALANDPNDLKAQNLLDSTRVRQRELTERYYREGLTAYSRGDRAESIRKMQDCRRLDPDFARAKQALIKIMQEGKE